MCWRGWIASDVRAALAQAQAAVRQAEAAVAQAGVERTQAEADLRRQQALQAKGFVSPQTVETAATRLNAAKAAVTTAEAAVGVARAQIKVQQVNLDYTEIRAPFDGVVLVKNATWATSSRVFQRGRRAGRGGHHGRHGGYAGGGGRRVGEQPGKAKIGSRWRSRSTRCPMRVFAAVWWASCPPWTAPRPP
jgi:hypothetical protein